jgi:ABC-2 type transport system permease protein
LFYGFEALADFNLIDGIQNLGMKTHFDSISRGVIDTRDLIYFLSITFFFLFLTKLKLEQE